MITLGSKVTDRITGVTGIALGRTEHLYGCVHIIIEPTELDKDGKPAEAQAYAEGRVQVLEVKKPKVSAHSSATSGGPKPSARTPAGGGR
jgi:hypothetical protein